VFFIENDNTDAAFHFSVEEFFMRFKKSDDPVYMLWQTNSTVMLGNNQVLSAEVDIDFANRNNIKVVRRSSGGGAIYTDSGTVLYTMIQPISKEAKVHMNEVAKIITDALSKLGVSAKREGRNDILVDGKKISGLAQYSIGSLICTHGSLLYDTDLDTLTKVLIANDSKLHPKGIASIRSRVTNIKPYTNTKFSTDEFISELKAELLKDIEYSAYQPIADDLFKVNSIYNEKYGNESWNFRL